MISVSLLVEHVGVVPLTDPLLLDDAVQRQLRAHLRTIGLDRGVRRLQHARRRRRWRNRAPDRPGDAPRQLLLG